MDRTPTPLSPGPLVLFGLMLVAALTRLLPHPPNFSPVEAIALFGGASFASRRWAMGIPLFAMLLSDVALGALHGGDYAGYLGGLSFWSVYACVALSVLMGFGLRGKATGTRVLGYALAGSVLFFAVTNCGAWISNPIYPRTLGGLGAAYVAGIPFFQWTVLGTVVYSALLFGGFALLRRRLPVLRARTA